MLNWIKGFFTIPEPTPPDKLDKSGHSGTHDNHYVNPKDREGGADSIDSGGNAHTHASYFILTLNSNCQRSTEDKKPHLWVAVDAALREGHTSPNEFDRQWDVEHNNLDPKDRCGTYGWIWEDRYTLLRCRLCGREVRVYYSEK